MALAHRPEHAEVPVVLAHLVGDDAAEAVWQNGTGGLTFRLGDRFLKWAPTGSGESIPDEVERLRWAAQHVAVPAVIDSGTTADGDWMLTRALPGTNAVSARGQADPRLTAREIGRGLRVLHDSLPVASCPFTWSVQSRLARKGAVSLPPQPAIDVLVVCHGDACAPNTLLDADGHFAGHVDLGRLGVADRWADLAVASYSLGWNFPSVHEEELYDAYGVAPDAERIAFYRALWDAG